MKKNILFKFTKYLFVALFIMPAFLPSNVFAEKVSFVGAGIGVAGILDDGKIMFGSIEFRPGFEIYRLRPWIGIEIADKIFYAALGILVDFNITDQLSIIPSFGAGFFKADDGIELGSSLEFKSALEICYSFNKQRKLGISFGHISNGGIDEINPGSEFIRISYYFSFF